jgi:hypothetical protein
MHSGGTFPVREAAVQTFTLPATRSLACGSGQALEGEVR